MKTLTQPKGGKIFTSAVERFNEQDTTVYITKNEFLAGGTKPEVHYKHGNSGGVLAYFKNKSEAWQFIKQIAPLNYIKEHVLIYDNGGETFDQYTFIDKNTGHMWGSSSNPFHPQGFGSYCGNRAEDFYRTTVGSGFLQRIEKEDPKHYKKLMKQAIKEQYLDSTESIEMGERVEDPKALPKEVIQFIIQSVE